MLLLTNPKGSMKELSLKDYAISDFESLNSIKGHLVNLFAELPHILPEDIRADVEQQHMPQKGEGYGT